MHVRSHSRWGTTEGPDRRPIARPSGKRKDDSSTFSVGKWIPEKGPSLPRPDTLVVPLCAGQPAARHGVNDEQSTGPSPWGKGETPKGLEQDATETGCHHSVGDAKQPVIRSTVSGHPEE